MKTEIEDIIRSTLVIQNKQSLGLCAEKIVKHIESKMESDVFISKNKIETPVEIMTNNLNSKCVHPYGAVEQNDFGVFICTICGEKLSY